MPKATAASDIAQRRPAVAVPTFDELTWPLLEALRAMGGSATNEELLAKIIEQEAYPHEVQSVQRTDGRQTKLNYNLAWAKTYPKKVGALENSSRGVWSLTKAGEQLTRQDVVAVPNRVRKQDLDERKQRSSPTRTPTRRPPLTPATSRRPKRIGRTSSSKRCAR